MASVRNRTIMLMYLAQLQLLGSDEYDDDYDAIVLYYLYNVIWMIHTKMLDICLCIHILQI